MEAKEAITEWHKHEMLDRISCVVLMFDSLVREHRACDLMASEIDNAGDVLASLYQRAGAIRFDESATAPMQVEAQPASLEDMPQDIVAAVAQGWCAPVNANKVMDTDLA